MLDTTMGHRDTKRYLDLEAKRKFLFKMTELRVSVKAGKRLAWQKARHTIMRTQVELHSAIPVLGGRERRIPGACWPVSLAQLSQILSQNSR